MGTRLIALDTVAVETFALRAISRMSMNGLQTNPLRLASYHGRAPTKFSRLILESVCPREQGELRLCYKTGH